MRNRPLHNRDFVVLAHVTQGPDRQSALGLKTEI